MLHRITETHPEREPVVVYQGARPDFTDLPTEIVFCEELNPGSRLIFHTSADGGATWEQAPDPRTPDPWVRRPGETTDPPARGEIPTWDEVMAEELIPAVRVD